MMSVATPSEVLDPGTGTTAQPSLDYGKIALLIGATGISWGLCIILGKLAIAMLDGLIGAPLAH
jgi:hypothetical protein